MKCLFSSRKSVFLVLAEKRREGKQRRELEGEREREKTGGKKREIVSALSANDVGKKEDGRERMDGNVGGGKRVIRKNRFNTKLLSSSLVRALRERGSRSSLVLKPKRYRHAAI